MTREEAQKSAQEKLQEAARLMQEAMALAEEHSFALHLGDAELDYKLPHELPYDDTFFPKGIVREQLDGFDQGWPGVSDDALDGVKNFSQWMSSSRYGDC